MAVPAIELRNITKVFLGKVVANNPGYPMRPIVVGFKTGKIYNLLEDLNCASMVIE